VTQPNPQESDANDPKALHASQQER
jgi:hypothetical protein